MITTVDPYQMIIYILIGVPIGFIGAYIVVIIHRYVPWWLMGLIILGYIGWLFN